MPPVPRASVAPQHLGCIPPVLLQISLEAAVANFEASVLQRQLKQLKAEQRAGKKGAEEQSKQAKVRMRWPVTSAALRSAAWRRARAGLPRLLAHHSPRGHSVAQRARSKLACLCHCMLWSAEGAGAAQR